MTSVPVLRRVGRYEIVGEIGRGATAIVHLARQADLDRSVALKELAALRAAEPALVERFLRESRVLAGLSHPNIVTVYEYFEHEGTPFIAMEYLPRGSLRPLLGSLELAQSAGVLEGVLEGLAHAATRGVVHRDLKPENLLVTAAGEIKIADFGIAKVVDADAGPLTVTGSTVGTPAYMAPEQAMAGEVGPAADLYATGVIAYELLAGRVPFDGSVPMAVMLQHLNDPVPPLRGERPDLDADLCDWVERLLAKQPEDRPTGAADAWDELDEILIRLLGPRWRRRSRLGAEPAPRPHGTSEAVTPATARVPRAPQSGARRRKVWTGLAAALLASLLGAAGIAAAVALSSTDAPRSSEVGRTTSESRPTTASTTPRPSTTVSAVDLDTRADPARATLRLTGAPLGAARVIVRDGDLRDGHGWFELRKAGIDARTHGTTNDALAVRVRKSKNALRIDVRVEGGPFERLSAARAGPRVVVATISRPAPDTTAPTRETSPPAEVDTTTTTAPEQPPKKKPLPTG